MSNLENDQRVIDPWLTRFDDQIETLDDELIQLRRHLHAHPEPSSEEVETSKFIAERLRKAGIEATICQNGIGVVANLTIGTPAENAPLIAIRGDIDALRMPDEKLVEYASKTPGITHACGHDAHTSILLGIALAGMGIRSEPPQSSEPFGIRLRFLFQPAEETSQGAHWMVEQGALSGVTAILGLHVDPERAGGEVGIRYGILTANCDEVEMTVKGHGGHAARPHHSLDPIAASAHLISSLYKFLPRSVDSRNPSVFTIGKIHGGYAPNVIPEHVELLGSLRTTDRESRETLQQRIREICSGTQQNSGTKIDVRFAAPLKSVYNDPRIVSVLEEVSCSVVGSENTKTIHQPSMGGEDFSVYLDHVPGALLRLGCGQPGENSPFLHSPLFDIDETILSLGARILMRTAMQLSLTWNSGSSTNGS